MDQTLKTVLLFIPYMPVFWWHMHQDLKKVNSNTRQNTAFVTTYAPYKYKCGERDASPVPFRLFNQGRNVTAPSAGLNSCNDRNTALTNKPCTKNNINNCWIMFHSRHSHHVKAPPNCSHFTSSVKLKFMVVAALIALKAAVAAGSRSFCQGGVPGRGRALALHTSHCSPPT